MPEDVQTHEGYKDTEIQEYRNIKIKLVCVDLRRVKRVIEIE